jgi:hypothetical protein
LVVGTKEPLEAVVISNASGLAVVEPLMNEGLESTKEQRDVLDLYGLGPESLVHCGPFLTLAADALDAATVKE